MPGYGGLGMVRWGTVQVCRGMVGYGGLGMMWYAGEWWVRYGVVLYRYALVWTHTGPSLCVTSGTSPLHSSTVIHS